MNDDPRILQLEQRVNMLERQISRLIQELADRDQEIMRLEFIVRSNKANFDELIDRLIEATKTS